jgi:hypothetical protein
MNNPVGMKQIGPEYRMTKKSAGRKDDPVRIGFRRK